MTGPEAEFKLPAPIYWRNEKMQVKYFAYIRDFTGCRSREEQYCTTVYELVHMLSDRYGARFRAKALSEDGESLGAEIIILVNGRHVEHLDGIRTALKPTDVVSIFPVVAGG